MKTHKVEQGTPEWFEVRKGKMTASHATAIANCGKGLDTYILELMAESYSSGEEESFTSKDTKRGIELEPLAREMYALENDLEITEVGFMEFNEYVGASPDGLVGKDGGIEIKSIEDVKYFKHLLYGDSEIDSGHNWQVQMNLLISKRKWWDLIYYNPNFQKSMCVYRIYPDKECFDMLLAGFAKGEQMIKEIKQKLK